MTIQGNTEFHDQKELGLIKQFCIINKHEVP